jgi:flagellar biosynthesis/type III secretory pathway M-ring protein FliF/YscJ
MENRYVAIGAVVAIALMFVVLGLFIRTMFKGEHAKPTALAPLPPGPDGAAQIAAQQPADLDEEADLQAQLDGAAIKETTKRAAVLVKRLRDNIDKDPVIPSHIVRGWVNEG